MSRNPTRLPSGWGWRFSAGLIAFVALLSAAAFAGANPARGYPLSAQPQTALTSAHATNREVYTSRYNPAQPVDTSTPTSTATITTSATPTIACTQGGFASAVNYAVAPEPQFHSSRQFQR